MVAFFLNYSNSSVYVAIPWRYLFHANNIVNIISMFLCFYNISYIMYVSVFK